MHKSYNKKWTFLKNNFVVYKIDACLKFLNTF